METAHCKYLAADLGTCPPPDSPEKQTCCSRCAPTGLNLKQTEGTFSAAWLLTAVGAWEDRVLAQHFTDQQHQRCEENRRKATA